MLPTLAAPPAAIARGVMFLASPAADYITGLEMRLDGGQP